MIQATLPCPSRPTNWPGQPRVLGLIAELITRLAREDVRYCHWKSNHRLREWLQGEGDLDLLVARRDSARFEQVIAELGFKRALAQPEIPGVGHYYGLDAATGRLVHLHVYYRVLTGESLLKDYALPIETMLLDAPTDIEGVPAPDPSAELISFVLRAMLKQASFGEWMLGWTKAGDARAELTALRRRGADAVRARSLLARWLPAVEPRLFDACLATLEQGRRRIGLASRLRRRLRPFRRINAASAWLLRGRAWLAGALRRIRRDRGAKTLASGGAIVAIIGPDASGKSTLVADCREWLGRVFRLRSAHLGKPPSTWLSLLPNLMHAVLRWMGIVRSTARSSAAEKTSHGLLYKLRSLLLARDRHAHAKKLHQQAANGRLVICDRYPSPDVGAMDSPRLAPSGLAARLEHRLYESMPPPHLVIELQTQVKVALDRNRSRQDEQAEPEEYVVHRHTAVRRPKFGQSHVIQLCNDGTREATILELRRLIWENL